jgi:hypothetical protein
MAFSQNPNGPRGLDVFRANRGTPGRLAEYRIDGTYATKIYSGNPVELHTDGTLIVPASVDSKILGVFQGCQYIDVAGETQFKPFWPAPGAVKANTVVRAFVTEAAGELFLIKSDEDLVQADVGEYFTMTSMVTGSDATGRANTSLDGSTNGTAVADKVLKLREIAQFDGTSQLAVVQFIRTENNEAQMFPATS